MGFENLWGLQAKNISNKTNNLLGSDQVSTAFMFSIRVTYLEEIM